jgi:hypothetical protein
MAYVPPGSLCWLCLSIDPRKCEDCEFEGDSEEDQFEEEIEEESE